MARFHSTDKGDVPFTAEEEAAWDAMEAAYVPPTTPTLTKEELLAQLQALQAQIQALT
jgi:hypothetical protein